MVIQNIDEFVVSSSGKVYKEEVVSNSRFFSTRQRSIAKVLPHAHIDHIQGACPN
jgi:hypothetical protein